ncbi:MAG: hypothetical protein MI806_07645 [Minwuiales bacterium]|nr:hypothetical protein [Minwuiales bacterium]
MLIVAATVLNFYLPAFSQKWRLIYPFNLGGEQNLAVWWSGILLFMAGVLFYEFYCRAADRLRLPWLLLAILMVTLSVDEIGSFHERLGGWRNMILIGLPFGMMFLYAIVQLLSRPQTRRAAYFTLAGFLCFGSVGIQEFLEHTVVWPDWSRGLRLGMEEGTELLGSFLVLCGIMDRRGAPDVAAGSAPEVGAMLPDLGCLRYIPAFLLVGVLLHLGIGMFAQANFDDMVERGNPGSWYPAVVFLLLSVAAVDKAMESPAKTRLFWQVAAAVFLMCSLGAVFARMSITANFVGLPRWLLVNFYFVYAGVAALASVALLAGWRRSGRHLLLLGAMAAVVAMELLLAGAAMPHLALGVFAYVAWYFFVLEPAPAIAPVRSISTV